MEELLKIIEGNDEEISKREKLLIDKVNKAYTKAINHAIVSFRYLEKLNPKIKPSSKQVKKIVEQVIKDFREEFEKLIGPFQKELGRQYEAGLEEAAQILSLKDEMQGKIPHQD